MNVEIHACFCTIRKMMRKRERKEEEEEEKEAWEKGKRVGKGSEELLMHSGAFSAAAPWE